MRAAVSLAALLLIAAAPAPPIAPTPPEPPTAHDEVLTRSLFGGPEPGDEEQAEGQGEASSAAPTAAPAAPSTEAYDARVRQSYAAAEAFQGRLDGGWIVSGRGRDLLQLQLVDKGKGQVEGAWRDLRAGAGLKASGLLDLTHVTDGALDLRFGPDEQKVYRLDLRRTANGGLAGTLRVNDEVFDVVLRRGP